MTAASLSSRGFVRAARRVRWMYRDDPQKRLLTLRQLSSAFDATATPARAAPRTVPVVPAAGTSVRDFATRVAETLDSPTLLYSDRLNLLRDARRSGIGRFEANLVIAAVQNRVRDEPMIDSVIVEKRLVQKRPIKKRPIKKRLVQPLVTRLVTTLGAIAGVQSLILAAVWWIARG